MGTLPGGSGPGWGNQGEPTDRRNPLCHNGLRGPEPVGKPRAPLNPPIREARGNYGIDTWQLLGAFGGWTRAGATCMYMRATLGGLRTLA